MLVTLEPVSRSMAGPAIRAVEMGRQLSVEHEVTVASPVKCSEEDRLRVSEPNLRILTGLSRSAMYNAAMDHDILVIQSNVLRPFPRLSELGKYLVVDLYDPYLFSILVQYKTDRVAGPASYRLMHQLLERHMQSADFSICASERQRDYWLGRFCAIGKITPDVYELDGSLRKLCDVVPFGLNPEPPARSGAGLRGKVPGIGADDPLLLWGGGIWDWFDPLTVVRAVDQARKQVPNLRLYFMGMKSPNPKVPLMKAALDTKALAESLGILDEHVFFGEGWVPYSERVDYLLDADIAVSSHFDLIETRFSFRTRILDYLWAGLPVLSTGGDELTDTIESVGAGKALPFEDVDAWAASIVELAGSKERRSRCSEAARELGQRYTWDKACRALLDFCRAPYKMPAYARLTMPSLLERARAVYSRGGKELVIKRSREILDDIFN